MFKISNIKLLKVIRYFIVNHNYKLVITGGRHDEVFLESISRKNFELVCLMDKQYIDKQAFILDIERVQEVVRRLKIKLMKYSIKTAIIFTSDNPHVNDGEEIEGIKIFKKTNNDFTSTEILENFPNINEEVNFQEENTNEKDEFAKTMNEITFYSKQKYETVKTDKKIIKFDAHKTFAWAIIIWNIFIFKVFPILGLSFNPIELLNLFGSSSFELTFINGQFWRPLAAGFLDFSIFNLLIDIWIFYSYGKTIRNMLGNKGYLITILLGSYITYFTISLFIPGVLLFGAGHLKAITLGAFMTSYWLKRIEYIKFYQFEAKSNLIIFLIILFLAPTSQKYLLAIGLLSGLLVSFAVVSLKDKNWFDLTSTLAVIASIIAFGIFGWSRLPMKHSAYLKLNRAYYTVFDNVYPASAQNIKQNICDYYQKEERGCKIY